MRELILTTTLAEIRKHRPCADGFAKIRNHFGVSAEEAKTHAVPFPVTLLLETNDLWDALWVFGRVAPQPMIDEFLIRRLDIGEHSALKTLRGMSGKWNAQIAAVEKVVALLRRRATGDDVTDDMRAAARAATDAAYAAYAAYAAAYAARAAARAAYTADVAARAASAAACAAYAVALDASAAARAAYTAGVAARAAARAASAARAAACADLRIVTGEHKFHSMEENTDA